MSRFDELLHTEMTRRQFLATLGLGIVSLFGFSALVGMLTEGESQKETGQPAYGSRSYGN
jgi:hypothetical protein